jgi:hypothetical protein
MKIEKNIGTVDRAVRIIAGAALLALVPLSIAGQLSEWAILGLLGVVPLLAGIIGYCPPYALLGINTRRGCKKEGDEPVEDNPETACC